MGIKEKIAGVRAISFDGDGTLWNFEKVMRNSLEYSLKELAKFEPIAYQKLDVDQMISIRNDVASELKGKVTNLELIRLQAFNRTLQVIGRPKNVKLRWTCWREYTARVV
jgi:putative hydrolase of the HAD superfamily